MKRQIVVRCGSPKVWLAPLVLAHLFFSSCSTGSPDATGSGDVKVGVDSERVTAAIELTLSKAELSNYLVIAPDAEIRTLLGEKEKAIEKAASDLARAQAEGKAEQALSAPRQKLQDAEGEFKTALFGEDSIRVVLEDDYPGPIYLPAAKANFPDFNFIAEGRLKTKIRVDELSDLERDVRGWLRIKDKPIEVRREGNDYRLDFDKATNITITVEEGKLEGIAGLPSGVRPQVGNPITFLETQAATGKLFKLRIPTDEIKKEDQLHLYFLKETKAYFPTSIPVGKTKPQDPFYVFEVKVPESIGGKVRAVAMIKDKEGEISVYNTAEFKVRNQGSAIGWGVGITVVVLLAISLLSTMGQKKRWRTAVLGFTETQYGRYSVSLLQIFIWTAITLFAYIYVFIIRGEFIKFTTQILTLLGISGATALASKATAMVRSRDIPEKYFIKGGVNLKKHKRTPKFRDYVSIGDNPNVFKLQILGFTIITGVIVVQELIRVSNFPQIPNELLTLMGISGGVYIGNETVTDNVWKKLKDKVDEAEKKLKAWKKDNKAETKAEYDELKDEVFDELQQMFPDAKEEIDEGDEDAKPGGDKVDSAESETKQTDADAAGQKPAPKSEGIDADVADKKLVESRLKVIEAKTEDTEPVPKVPITPDITIPQSTGTELTVVDADNPEPVVITDEDVPEKPLVREGPSKKAEDTGHTTKKGRKGRSSKKSQ